MSAVVSPVDVERKLVWLSKKLDEATAEIAELDEKAVLAKSAYEVAQAHSYLSCEGSIEARKATATLETADEKLLHELAEAAVRACKERLRTLSLQVEITRSLAASVRSSMAAA